jgi:hypothetical protein
MNSRTINHSLIHIHQRSSTMKHSTFSSRTLATVALVGLTVASLSAQNLRNRGTIVNTGTATYNSITNYRTGTGGTIINRGTLNSNTTFVNGDGGTALGTVRNYVGGTGAGTVRVTTNWDNGGGTFDNDSLGGGTYVGRLRIGGTATATGTFDTDSGNVEYFGAGAQSIVATTYGALVASVGGTKSMTGTVVVRDTFRITSGATFATSASTDSLALLATTASNAGTFTATSGAVNYGADADQTVFGGTYQRLWLSGSSSARSKTTTSGLSFAASGSLSVGTNDTLVVSGGNLDLATNTPSFTNSSAVKVLADASFHGGITNAGTFYYAGTSAQAIGAVTYNDLRLGGSGAKNFPNATVGILSNYTIDGGTGTRDYTTAGSSATLAFQGTSGGQTISNLSGESLNILEFSGAATKSLNGTSLSANLLSVLGTSGAVTNSITGTFTLANISGVSMTVASGATFNNGATATISMNGDLENDGTIVNDGTISVY